MSQMTPYCFKCGAELDPEAIYCPECGRLQRSMVVRSSGAPAPPPPPPPGQQYQQDFYPDPDQPAAGEAPGYPDHTQQQEAGQSGPYGAWYAAEPEAPASELHGDHVYAQQGYPDQPFEQPGQPFEQPGQPYDQDYAYDDSAYSQPADAEGQDQDRPPDYHDAYERTHRLPRAQPEQDDVYAGAAQPESPYGQPGPPDQYPGAEPGDLYERVGQPEPPYSQAGSPNPYSGAEPGDYYARAEPDEANPAAAPGPSYPPADPYSIRRTSRYGAADSGPASRTAGAARYSVPYTGPSYGPDGLPPDRQGPSPLRLWALVAAGLLGLLLIGFAIGHAIGGPSSPTASTVPRVSLPPADTPAPTTRPASTPAQTPAATPAADQGGGNATFQRVSGGASISGRCSTRQGCPVQVTLKNTGGRGGGTVTVGLVDDAGNPIATFTGPIPVTDPGATVQVSGYATGDQLNPYLVTGGLVHIATIDARSS